MVKKIDTRTIDQYSDTDLKAIAEERQGWAKTARDIDMTGSAAEWEFTAKVIEELIRLRWVHRIDLDKPLPTEEEG